MGVPVVTLAGREHRARVGASLLTAAGCGAWIAQDVEAYVSKAAALAGDPAGLLRTHRELREKVLRSTLCDAPGYAVRFEAALRGAWRAWCAADAPGRS
jgi:predicted O-linked N-acetylglucosamine transferase (SPINDLY family)